jgi:Leucine-rich repeat (LRR) protein
MNNTQYQGFEVCHIALEERLRQKLQQAHKDKCKELSLANLSLETFPGAFEVLPEDVAMLKQVISQTETGEEIESKDVLPKGEDACPRVTPLEKALRPLLIHLESIDLSNNDLTSYDSFPSTRLPSAVRCLSSLKSLTLRNNNLDRLPSFLFNLTWLQSLRLDLNALQTLKGFHHMTSLTELNVLMNEIEGNVKQLAALTNLQVLVLGMNHITRLPKLNRLTGLRSLHLNDNKLGTGKQRPKRKDTPPSAALPQSPSSSTRVSEFERLLSRLPPHSLADLVLGGNLLGPEIPSSIGAFKALTRLDVSRNGITTFPDSLFELAQLRALSLSRNAITLVPPALSRLTQLSHLRLDGNNISCLEEECFLSLTQLQILEAQANQIHTFPTFTLKLISYSLRELDLSNNCIEALPEDETLLLALSKLSKLRLSYNLFETIPSCLRGYPAFASYASAFTAQQIITGLYIGCFPSPGNSPNGYHLQEAWRLHEIKAS